MNEFGRAGAHALSGGLQSHLQGGSFRQGLLSGGISSVIGSTLSGGGAGAQIFGSGLGGGAGSVIGGGNFFSGFGQGVAVGAFNHALHSGAVAVEECCGEGAGIRQGIMEREYLKGNISETQFIQWLNAQGKGALWGLSFSSAPIRGLGAAYGAYKIWKLRRFIATGAKIHPRLLKQLNAGHRGTTFLRKEIARFGKIVHRSANRVSIHYTTSAGQNFSLGYYPTTKMIYHLAPGF